MTLVHPQQLAQMPLTLNEDQKKATQHVLNAQHQYQAFLLDGLTGSGKLKFICTSCMKC